MVSPLPSTSATQQPFLHPQDGISTVYIKASWVSVMVAIHTQPRCPFLGGLVTPTPLKAKILRHAQDRSTWKSQASYEN
jgi:hypothetical protein